MTNDQSLAMCIVDRVGILMFEMYELSDHGMSNLEDVYEEILKDITQEERDAHFARIEPTEDDEQLGIA